GDIEAEAAAAHAAGEDPWSAFPLQLGVGVDAADFIAFVAPQIALHAEAVADEVLETLAVVYRARHVDAHGGAQGATSQLAHRAPVGVDAVDVAVEIDHAARVRGRGLEAAREGLVLDHAAVAGIGGQQQAVGPEALLPREAELLVVDALARVIAFGQGALGRLGVGEVGLAGARV